MGSKAIQNIVRIILYAVLLAGCVKDKPADPVATTQSTAKESVYVVCEGNMGNGDGSLYQYDPVSNVVTGDVYNTVNAGNLGDVFQSMQRIGERLFLCVNNSDKIVVLNRADKKQVGSISIPKPRYILAVSDTKAYVSSIFGNKLYIINPQTLELTGSVMMPYQNPEGMVLYNGAAVICTWDTACSNIYAIDTATNQLAKTIPVSGAAPHSVVVDKDNRLWVLSGNTFKNKSSVFTVLNEQWQVIKTYPFVTKTEVVKPVFDATTGFLYFIEVDYNGGTVNNGVYRMNVYDANLPSAPFVAAKQFQYFWALGIHPKSGRVYIGDPKGFIQKGSVMVCNNDGSISTQFAVGVGPGHFFFD